MVAGAFGCGYLVRAGRNEAPDLVRDWPVHRFGPLIYHLHPRATLGTATADGSGSEPAAGRNLDARRVVVIGNPVDVNASEHDLDHICRRVLREWQLGGRDAAVRYLAYLGGRWTAFLEQPAEPGPAATGQAKITVIPDCQATQAVFYSSTRGLALGSQPVLVADTVGSGPDAAAEQMWTDLRAARPSGVIFLPGIMTTHEQVLPLVPNHLLDITLDGDAVRVSHERFWPFADRVERTDTSLVVGEFIDHFKEHTALLCRFGRPVLSLTGGMDSRTSLVGALPHLGEDSFTFTYFNPRDGLVKPGAAEDVFEANALAYAVGIPHRTLRWRNPAKGGVFFEIVQRTYPVRRPSVGAAHAMWADLPRDIIHLQSIGAELGTTFYTDRPEVPISPAALLRIVSNRSDLPDSMARTAFADYLEYADFTEAAIGGYDFRDVFYWEQRMGKWGYMKYQDGDFSHRMLMPFNSRGLIETMQSLPYPLREGKVLLRELLATVPALAADRPSDAAGEWIGWRSVLAARPHLRPRIRRAWARVSDRSTR